MSGIHEQSPRAVETANYPTDLSKSLETLDYSKLIDKLTKMAHDEGRSISLQVLDNEKESVKGKRIRFFNSNDQQELKNLINQNKSTEAIIKFYELIKNGSIIFEVKDVNGTVRAFTSDTISQKLQNGHKLVYKDGLIRQYEEIMKLDGKELQQLAKVVDSTLKISAIQTEKNTNEQPSPTPQASKTKEEPVKAEKEPPQGAQTTDKAVKEELPLSKAEAELEAHSDMTVETEAPKAAPMEKKPQPKVEAPKKELEAHPAMAAEIEAIQAAIAEEKPVPKIEIPEKEEEAPKEVVDEEKPKLEVKAPKKEAVKSKKKPTKEPVDEQEVKVSQKEIEVESKTPMETEDVEENGDVEKDTELDEEVGNTKSPKEVP